MRLQSAAVQPFVCIFDLVINYELQGVNGLDLVRKKCHLPNFGVVNHPAFIHRITQRIGNSDEIFQT